MKHISLPLPEEVFYELDNLDQSEYCIDVDKIDFGDEDKIESTIIYMRNLQINMPLDFSNISFEEKSKWILKYLTFNFRDSCIKELDESILTILANEYIELNCIFSPEEVEKFRDSNKDLVDNIIKFLVSLNIISFILMDCHDSEILSYDENDYKDIEIIKERPSYLSTIVNIMKKYPLHCDGIRLYYNDTTTPALYDCVIEDINKNFELYDIILHLPSIQFLNLA